MFAYACASMRIGNNMLGVANHGSATIIARHGCFVIGTYQWSGSD